MRKEIVKLLEQENFCKELLKLGSESEVKKFFKDEGKVDITDEETMELKKIINQVREKVSKMSDDQLNEVSGGSMDSYDQAVSMAGGGKFMKGAGVLAAGIGLSTLFIRTANSRR